jgi:hypothetical protein
VSSAFPAPATNPVHQPEVGQLPLTTTTLGSGVYMGGRGPTRSGAGLLQAGSRYVIARDRDELQILGPVHIDAAKVVARIPLAECDVSTEGGHLMVQGRLANAGLTLAFSATAMARGLDLTTAFSVADPNADEPR